MAYGDVLCPTNAAVYLGDYLVDACYDVRWEVQDTTSPSFDYARREYRAIAPGKVLVNGSLAINFKYAGYLNTAIAAAMTGGTNTRGKEDAALLASFVRPMIYGTRKERIDILTEAAKKGQVFLDKVCNVSSALLAREIPSAGNGHGEKFVSPMDLQNGSPLGKIQPVNIHVFYGDPNDTFIMDKVEDVVFVGTSKTLSGGASSGGGVSSSGAPILELYSFFAKNVSQWRMSPSGEWTRSQ